MKFKFQRKPSSCSVRNISEFHTLHLIGVCFRQQQKTWFRNCPHSTTLLTNSQQDCKYLYLFPSWQHSQLSSFIWLVYDNASQMASRNHIHWVWYQPQVPLGEWMGKLGNKVEVTLIDQYSPKTNWNIHAKVSYSTETFC